MGSARPRRVRSPSQVGLRARLAALSVAALALASVPSGLGQAGGWDRALAEALLEQVHGTSFAQAGDADLFAWTLELHDGWDESWTFAERDEVLDLARAYASAHGDPGARAHVAHSEVVRYLEQGRLEDAASRLEAAIEACPSRYDAHLDLLLLAAQVDAELGRDRSAERRLDELEAIVRSRGPVATASPTDLTFLAVGQAVRVQLYVILGLLDVATRSARGAVETGAVLEARFGDRTERLLAELRLAEIYNLSDRYGRAVELARRVAAEAEELPDLRARARAVLAFALAKQELERDGDLGAEPALRRAIDDPALAPDVRLRSRQFLVELLLARDAASSEPVSEELARIAVELEGLGGPDTPGLELEAARGAGLAVVSALRSEADPDRLRVLTEELRTRWRALVDAWAARPLRNGGIGFLQLRQRAEVLDALVRACLELEGEGPEAALAHVLEAQSLGTLARRSGVGSPALDEVRSTLFSDGAGALVVFAADSGSHLFAVDDEAVVHASLETRDVLGGYAETLAQRVREGDRVRVEATARALSARVLSPEIVERVRSWEHVHLVGLELVRDLLVELLPLGEGGPPLGVAHPTSRLPSLPLGVALARRDPRNSLPLDVVTVVGSEPDELARERSAKPLAAVALTGSEREALRKGFEPHRIRLYEGGDAVLDRLGRPARLLHVVAHGIEDDSDPARERTSTLVLAPDAANGDGLVTCDEVEALEVAPFVFLSACRTARAPMRLGEDGVQHLGGAFLFAGALAVVLSPEAVELRSILRLEAAFERGLREGLTVSEALRRARLDDPEPGVHAFVRVFGLGDRRPFAAAD